MGGMSAGGMGGQGMSQGMASFGKGGNMMQGMGKQGMSKGDMFQQFQQQDLGGGGKEGPQIEEPDFDMKRGEMKNPFDGVVNKGVELGTDLVTAPLDVVQDVSPVDLEF
jgi:hypothetical protein